jgi:PTS system nitrogen regulatory IIA component
MQLTVRDAARFLRVSERTIYRWIREGSIPTYKIQEQYRFNRVELLEWATRQRIAVAPEIFHETEQTEPLPSLSEALEAGGIHYRVSGDDKESVIRSVVTLLRLPDEVDKEFVHAVFMARESLGSTGVGDGIAIPHVRNPVVLHVSRPQMALCFLEKPVDFGALDGKPVFALFALLTPTVRAHLQLLSRVAFLLKEDEFRNVLKRQGSREEILRVVRDLESRLAAGKPDPGLARESSG